MKLFGDEPQEKAMRKLVHDTANRTCSIGASLKVLEYRIVDGETDKMQESIDRMREQIVKLEKDIDIYFEKFKNDFK